MSSLTSQKDNETKAVTVVSHTTVPRKRRGPERKTARNQAFAAAYDAGASKEELSAMFNLRPNTVEQYIMKLRRWGLITRIQQTQRHGNEDRNRQIAKQNQEGASVTVLAQKFGLSTMQIRNILSEAEARSETLVEVDPLVYPGLRVSTVEAVVQGGVEAFSAHQHEIVSALTAALRVYERTA